METTYEPGLFKMDENGNISSVMITYEYNDKDGTTTETRNDMRVIPNGVMEIGGYLFLDNCQFAWDNKCVDGCDMWMYGSKMPLVHLLVRKSDGAIFAAVDENYQDIASDFLETNPPYYVINIAGYNTYGSVDGKGDTYVKGGNRISKISTKNGKLQIEVITPNDYRVDTDGMYFVSDNGTIVYRYLFVHNLFFPGGGFYEYVNKGEDICKYTWLFPYSGGVMRVAFTMENGNPYLNLYDFNLGTSVGTQSDNKTIASVKLDNKDVFYTNGTNIEFDRSYDFDGFYETDTHYIIFNSFFIEKAAPMVVHRLSKEQRDHLNLEADQIVFNNVIYYLDDNNNRINWFNLENMQYGELTLDEPFSKIKPQSHVFNSRNGEIIFTGISYATGYSAVCTLELTTGRYVIREIPSSRPVCNLVPIS